MIKLTDEMVEAYADACTALNQEQMHGRPPKSQEEKRRAGLAAVLALVERDYDDLAARIAKLEGAFEVASESRNRWRLRAIEAGWTSTPAPPRCGQRRRGMSCELAEGHGGGHGRSSWEEWS